MVMSPVSWSKEIETEILWQDYQHKELVSQIHILYNAIMNKKDINQVQEIFQFLDVYVKDHFGIEEQYMDVYDYPEKDNHLAEHMSFIKNYQSMKEMYNKTRTSVSTLCFDLNEWIINHIKNADKKLGDYLSSRVTSL